jgi:CheY-like chemotaxis protein
MDSMVKHILIADDDEDDRMLFADALRQVSQSTNLSMATDGVELLSMLRLAASLPDVIFLDLNMPGKNGADSLKEIKKDPHLSRLPIIIFTTTANHKTIDQMYALGAQYYIQKPADFEVLKSLIGRILSAGVDGVSSSRTEFIKYMHE